MGHKQQEDAMMLFYVSIGLAIVSSLVYHVSQKATPGSAHPILALIVTYIVATVVCLIILPFVPLRAGLIESLKQLNWASYLLALSIVGLEIGFLMAYRGGWNISQAAVFVNAAVAVVLIPVGIVAFREKASLLNLLGVAFCIVGLFLINQK
jgi:hypothetical protein